MSKKNNTKTIINGLKNIIAGGVHRPKGSVAWKQRRWPNQLRPKVMLWFVVQQGGCRVN